jgi:hypothetical protein
MTLLIEYCTSTLIEILMPRLLRLKCLQSPSALSCCLRAVALLQVVCWILACEPRRQRLDKSLYTTTGRQD